MRELSLNLLDIAQNSIVAGAALTKISISYNTAADSLTMIISDNGKGMSQEQLERVTDPFFTTRSTRGVGLGVPLFKMAAESTGGSFSIDSTLGVGTTLEAVFVPSHLDFTPLGDVVSTFVALITMNPDLDFLFTVSKDDAIFELNTMELREILGDVPFSSPEIGQWLQEYTRENMAELLID